ncbi:MAG: radical SAM protein [Candidatus Omnitrophica bacterium]|nr:radical SAM protein [Candidatus Omnitrophota bacterium]MBU1869944.1 radical SAM protein [Candidatus Omnitrophota bacterium]
MNILKYSSIAKQKPFVCARWLRAFFCSNILRRRVLRGVEFAVTYKCQVNCVKCSCADLVNNHRRELSTEEIINLSNQVINAGALLINFTGGEALLRNDIMDILRKLKDRSVVLSLSTNALLYSESLMNDLKKSGLNVIQVSLNSPYADEHDREIGIKGSFSRSLACIMEARSLGIEVLINSVITRDILYSDRMEKLYNIAKQNKSYLSFIFPARVGGWKEENVNLDYADYQIIKKWLNLSFVTTDSETCFKGRICPAGTEKVYISPYGDLYPCPFIHNNQGNILDKGFFDLWNSMSVNSFNHCLNLRM